MIPHWTLHRAMISALFCAMLFSMAPTLAGAIDTSRTVKSISRTTVSEVPRDGEGREGKEMQRMSIPFFMSGVILGGLLGLLGYCMLPRWRSRQERQRDIDQLTEQFQALFRESDQGKNHYS